MDEPLKGKKKKSEQRSERQEATISNDRKIYPEIARNFAIIVSTVLA
jgi:hypothetical protein